jgi:enoyl-CoA hydratase/carnithine racemase
MAVNYRQFVNVLVQAQERLQIADCADLRIVPTFSQIALPGRGFGRTTSAQSKRLARRIGTHDLKSSSGVRLSRSARPTRQRM